MLPSSDDILKRENTDDSFKLLFASRVLYNQAEVLVYISWIINIITAILLLLFSQSYIVVVISILLEIAVWVITKVYKGKCKNAGEIRNHFDKKVIFNKQKTELSFQLREMVIKIVEKNPCKFEKIVSSDGCSNPPGLMNWYEFPKPLLPKKAQCSCQGQNIWWNRKMISAKIIMILAFILLLVIIGFILIVLNGFKPSFLAAVGVIIIKLLDQLVDYFKYFRTMTQLNRIYELFKDDATEKEIEKIQLLIEEKRKMPILQINLYHRIRAKKLTDLYRKCKL